MINKPCPTPCFPKPEQTAVLQLSKSSLVHVAGAKMPPPTAPGLTGRQDTASRPQLRAHGNTQGWQQRPRHLGAEWVPFTSHPVTRPRQHCQQVWRSWPASQDLDYTPEPKQFTVKPGICNLGEVTGALNPGNFWSKLPVAQFPPSTVIKQLRFQPPVPLFHHFPKHLLRPRYFLSNAMNACSDTVPALRAE